MVLVPANISGPAAIRHDGICNRILINPLLWHQIPPEERQFIIEHELAHCRQNVFGEVEADRIGFVNYVKKGGDPDIPFQALVNNLNPQSPQYFDRTLAMRQRKTEHMKGHPISYYDWNFDSQYPDINVQGGGSSPHYGDNWGATEWLQLSELLAGLGIGIANAAGGGNGGYPQTPPSASGSGLDTGSMLMIGGIVAVLLVLIILAFRK